MLKVAVIGGGSTYTPELVNGFLARTASFPLAELWLISPQRLEVLGGFAQRVVQAVLADMLATSRPYLPQFFQENQP